MAANYDRCWGTENRVSAGKVAPENPLPDDAWLDTTVYEWKVYVDSTDGWKTLTELQTP